MFHEELRRLACVAIAIAGLILAVPAASQAEFTSPYTTQCSGGEAPGLVSSPQTAIADDWASLFEEEDTASPFSCPRRGSIVNPLGTANLEVLETFGSANRLRNPEYVFGGGEEPPTPSQWLNIDLGDKPGEDSGLIRQIPVASTAVVPLVNFPVGCAIPAKEATTDGRFTVSDSQLEAVYAGAISTWGELLPDIEASCANLPITRVVPAGAEGTTFVFKQWLGKVAPSRGWESLANAAWPNDDGATATVRSPGADRSEARLVAETSGSVGFASLPNARIQGFGYFSPENPRYIPGRFWLPVQNGAGERVEPTRDPSSGKDNVEGANCDNPTFNYVPSGYDTTVTPIWRYVTAVGSKTGWPICTLTYTLAWDDASTVYGNTEAVQARQRTVKDFLAYVLSTDGQEEAKRRDYSPLPPALLVDAEEGQSRVGWAKGSTPGAIKTQIAAAAQHAKP